MKPFNDETSFDALLASCKEFGAKQFRVFDGEDWAGEMTFQRATIKKQVNSTGEDWVLCYDADGEKLGYFYVIWNNGDPDGLVTDYGVNEFTEAVWAHWSAKFN